MENRKFIINIESERLLLRNILPEDRDFIIRLWTDPEVTEYMGGPRDISRMEEGVDNNIRKPFQEEYDLWVLVEKSSGKPVGHCGLLSKDVEGISEVEVIYVISREYWGNGYATEIAGSLISYAFEEKKLESVIALIKPMNRASEKVAVKAGMKLEKEVTRLDNIQMLLYRKKRKAC